MTKKQATNIANLLMSMTVAENDDLPCKADSILAQVITLLEKEAGIPPGNIALTDSDNIEQYKYYTQLGQIQEPKKL